MLRGLLAIVLALGLTIYHVQGHGRMLDPPSRSSVWRFPEFEHLNPIPNWNDNELFCGGAGVQHGQNGGKCGPCGDAWHLPKPRDNESGGKYSLNGFPVRTYSPGQVVDIHIDLTTSHLGYFQFRLCAHNNPSVPEEETCFDQNLLQLAEGGTEYYITGPSGQYYPKIVLPQGVTCEQCVLQWHYRAGNTWGDCGNGTSAAGCGPQETFRNCADIRIQ